MTMLQCDVVIVGAGAAGSTLAATLREAGIRDVVLLERGPHYARSFFNQLEREMQVLRAEQGTRTTSDGAIPVQSGECVGGGTTINYALCFDPIAEVWQGWRAAYGVTGFSFSECAADYGVPGLNLARALRDVRRRIGVRAPELPPNENNTCFRRGLERLNLPVRTFELNMDGCVGCGFCGSGCSYDAKRGTLVTYVRDAQAAGVRLVHHCDVQRIVLEPRDGRLTAVGVEAMVAPTRAGSLANSVPAGNLRIDAHLVILAGGAAATPALLQRSHVPDANDRLGTGVVLHPSLPIGGIMPTPISNYRGITGTYYSDAYRTSHHLYLECLFDQPIDTALALPGIGRDHFARMQAYPRLAGFGVMLVDEVQRHNRVRWNANAQRIAIDYQLSESDRERLRFGAARSVEIMFAAGAERVFLTSTERLRTLSSPIFSEASQAAECSALAFRAHETLLASAHIQASTKMGAAERDCFADARGEAHAVERLIVCDASSFPTSCGANPMVAIMTLARYQGLRIAAERKRYGIPGST